jgi:hypothetical protein
MSSSYNRSVELVDVPITNPNISFAPLHRSAEVENLSKDVNDDKQSKPRKKILTKCVTVIGDGTDKEI